MTIKGKLGLYAAAATVALLGMASPASAQATRTWVSGTGSDANPCSRTAPCQTFAGAISKTAANGEINCLDPGGYGSVTITKSITIDCTGTFGSILNSGTTGVLVNDSTSATPGTAEVILRGLSINGGGTTAGVHGIRLLSGRSLVVENVMVQNQNGGNGITIAPSVSAEVYLENVTVTDGATGIQIQPTGASGALRATFRGVRSQNNSGNGLNIDTTGNTAPFGIVVNVEESRFSGNVDGIRVNAPAGTTTAAVMLDDSDISNNSGTGLITAGSTNARMRVGNTVVTGNSTGVSPGVGIINSYGNNRNDGNGADGGFTAGIQPQE